MIKKDYKYLKRISIIPISLKIATIALLIGVLVATIFWVMNMLNDVWVDILTSKGKGDEIQLRQVKQALINKQSEIEPKIWVIKTKSDMPTIVNLIKKYANEYSVDEQLALNIAFCESGYENISNYQGERYGIGIYQFIKSTWDEQCKGSIWNEEHNIKCAIKLISKGELWRWDMSKSCWE